MRVVSRHIFLIGTLGLTGCVPFPNLRYYAPAVSGIVMQDGKPAAGVEIRVSAHFANEVRAAIAASDGRFNTDSIRKLLTATLVGDPLYGYTVEIRNACNVYSGFVDFSVGHAPSAIQLNCDLSRPVGRVGHQVYCTASDDRASS